LFRPGTIAGKVHRDYCMYKHGEKEVKYAHPMMKDLLETTFGMMVYQEQILKVARAMAGFSAGEADYLRKGIGKKDPELVKKLKKQFVEGCAKNGIDEKKAATVADLIEHFSGYGFNRAHSAAYAYLAYQTAWLKTHHPLEFMSSLLSSVMTNDAKRVKYERACEGMSLPLLPHHINKSKVLYAIEGIGIRRPLTALKKVGHKAVEEIVRHQPYGNLDDFVSKVDGHVVNRGVFEALANSGCMECFGMTKKMLLSSFEEAKTRAKKKAAERKKYAAFGDSDLFDCPV
jgi:DNA polymerase-3 subunit alpha